MSLQSNLNTQALIQLPKIWAALNMTNPSDYSNIYQLALNAIMNSAIPLDLMSDNEKSNFDLSLYSAYHDKGYIKSNK